MKCDDCLNILEAYVDGEVDERNSESVRAHLITCSACESAFEAFTAEGELFARYDRELQISPAMWNGIAARIATETPAVKRSRPESPGWFAGLFAMPRFGFAFSGAAAVLIAVFAVGYLYLKTNEPDRLHIAGSNNVRPSAATILSENSPTPDKNLAQPDVPSETGPVVVAKASQSRGPKPRVGESDVLFTDAGYKDYEDRDTASHLERAQNLLTSFRTIQAPDDEQEVDVSYEKAESRKLLNENVVLRRDAEMTGKFPAKSVLGSLEPFLIDIANLPDKATVREVQQIKDRVQRTEIVAELRSY